MKKQINCKEVVWELFTLTAAVAIIAAAVYFFLVPSHASVSSISGLGIILTNFIPLPLSVITMVLNVVLLIIGFITCGREFGTKTVYTSILLPVFIGIFERIFPNIGSLTKTQELDVLCYVLVVSVGLSILFNMNASSGGLDIVAKIMNKYLHIELGKAMSLAGMCVALSAALVYDKKTVVLSVLGTYFNGMVVDHFIFGQNLKRRVCIITKYEEELRNFILHELHSGATIYDAIGAYNLDKRHEIITIVDKNEYQKLMNYINNLDPKAFVTVYTQHGKIAHRLEKHRNGTQIFAERPVILERKCQSNTCDVIKRVPGKEQPEHDLLQIRGLHQEQAGNQRQRQYKHHIAQSAQLFLSRLLRLLVGQKIQHHRRPAGVAAPAAPEQQRAEYLCYGIVDGRRFKNAEEQIVPKALDLHIFTGDHAEIQQHIAAHRQLHEVTGISLPGGEEHRPRCEAAAYVAEIQQVEQVVLHKP